MQCAADRAVLAVLVTLSLLGCAALATATRWGPGIGPDSAVYVGVARSLLAGDGLVTRIGAGDEPRPLTQYPPLFPVVLAALGSFGFDPLAGARLINIGLFGLNILLVGLMLRSIAPNSRFLPPLGAFLALASPTQLGIHAAVLSEALFLFLSFTGLFFLGRYIDRPRPTVLLAASVATAMAFLTRYTGAAVVATGVVALLWLGRGSWRQRLYASSVFAAVAGAPGVLWMLRNWVMTGNLASREIAFHPIGPSALGRTAGVIGRWFLIENLPVAILLAVVLAAAAGVVHRGFRGPGRVATLPGVLLAFVVVYAIFLGVSISFVDANTPLNSRLLSPVFVAVLVLVLHRADALLKTQRGARAALPAAVAGACFALSYGFLGMKWTVEMAEHGGIGFGNRRWSRSEIIQKVRELPPEIEIYTNGADALYLLAGRASRSVPPKWLPRTRQENSEIRAELGEMRKMLLEQRALLVWLDGITWRWYLPSEHELSEWLGLRRHERVSDGAIYGLDRERRERDDH